jgi:ABC-type sugar transport system ATPase subunit
MSAIRIEDLRVAFGELRVLESLTLAVERGEIVAVLGPSGCGKSTLLRAIAGLDVHPLGTIAVEGDVGYVFQEPRSTSKKTCASRRAPRKSANASTR